VVDYSYFHGKSSPSVSLSQTLVKYTILSGFARFLAIKMLLFVPLDWPSQKQTTSSAAAIISLFLINPAALPNFCQSGLKISVGILFSLAYFSPKESAPRAPPDSCFFY